MRKKIKCFIAMPFGKSDCDRLYKKQISPVLRALTIDPVKVDIREHKEDLNVFIIRMLKESDIALADLTYARPSVYYEAGFAERQSPVIYTARKDHLSRAQPDDQLRVHFDLEMKKIVHWQDPLDRTFKDRLRKRLSYYVKPLREQIDKDEREQAARLAFMSKSVKDRMDEVMGTFTSELLRRRFWAGPLLSVYPYLRRLVYGGRAIVAAKLSEKICYYCVVLIADYLSKKQIVEALNRLPSRTFVSTDYPVAAFEEHYYFISLRKIAPSRFASMVPDATYDARKQCYMIKPRTGLKKVSYERGTIQIDAPSSKVKQVSLHLLSPIDSGEKMAQSIAEYAGAFPKSKTNRFAYVERGAIRLSKKRQKSQAEKKEQE